MFLVEYQEGIFIDAEDISWLSVKPGRILFGLKSDTDPTEEWRVSDKLHLSFLNHVQAINSNISSIEASYSDNKAMNHEQSKVHTGSVVHRRV